MSGNSKMCIYNLTVYTTYCPILYIHYHNMIHEQPQWIIANRQSAVAEFQRQFEALIYQTTEMLEAISATYCIDNNNSTTPLIKASSVH